MQNLSFDINLFNSSLYPSNSTDFRKPTSINSPGLSNQFRTAPFSFNPSQFRQTPLRIAHKDKFPVVHDESQKKLSWSLADALRAQSLANTEIQEPVNSSAIPEDEIGVSVSLINEDPNFFTSMLSNSEDDALLKFLSEPIVSEVSLTHPIDSTIIQSNTTAVVPSFDETQSNQFQSQLISADEFQALFGGFNEVEEDQGTVLNFDANENTNPFWHLFNADHSDSTHHNATNESKDSPSSNDASRIVLNDPSSTSSSPTSIFSSPDPRSCSSSPTTQFQNTGVYAQSRSKKIKHKRSISEVDEPEESLPKLQKIKEESDVANEEKKALRREKNRLSAKKSRNTQRELIQKLTGENEALKFYQKNVAKTLSSLKMLLEIHQSQSTADNLVCEQKEVHEAIQALVTESIQHSKELEHHLSEKNK